MNDDDKNLFEDTDIDYSEGIGDLLKDKSDFEFSWKKTGTVLAGFIVVLAISVAAVSKLAKALIIPSPDQYQAFEYSPDANTKPTSHYGHEEDHNNDSQHHQLGVVDEAEEAQESTPSIESVTAQTDAQEQASQVAQSKTVQQEVAQTKAQQTASQTSSPEPGPDALYRVVIGNYLNHQAAANVLKQLKQDRVAGYIWQNNESGQAVYRVQVGAFSKESSAKTLQARLSKKGYQPAILYR